jgi:hypothetical protein
MLGPWGSPNQKLDYVIPRGRSITGHVSGSEQLLGANVLQERSKELVAGLGNGGLRERGRG